MSMHGDLAQSPDFTASPKARRAFRVALDMSPSKPDGKSPRIDGPAGQQRAGSSCQSSPADCALSDRYRARHCFDSSSAPSNVLSSPLPWYRMPKHVNRTPGQNVLPCTEFSTASDKNSVRASCWQIRQHIGWTGTCGGFRVQCWTQEARLRAWNRPLRQFRRRRRQRLTKRRGRRQQF